MTNPTLTLEEELNVLEAVYKIGKEKGLDLLRPEQMKKLMDGGRVVDNRDSKKLNEFSDETDSPKVGTNLVGMADLFVYCLRQSVEKILIEREHYCSPEEWAHKDKSVKAKVVNLFFYLFYGVEEGELYQQMLVKFSGGKGQTHV